MKPVETARKLRDRKVQRALLQFFAPENYFTVREALEQAGRADLIGDGPLCLIPSRAPREAIEARGDARRSTRPRRPRGPATDGPRGAGASRI